MRLTLLGVFLLEQIALFFLGAFVIVVGIIATILQIRFLGGWLSTHTPNASDWAAIIAAAAAAAPSLGGAGMTALGFRMITMAFQQLRNIPKACFAARQDSDGPSP